jgi:ribose transport system substrate-binding protein
VTEPASPLPSSTSSSDPRREYEPPHPRYRTFSPLSILIIAILAGLVMWYAGVFKGKPRVAIVTSGEGAYWDPVIAGAQDAAKKNDVELTIIRSKSDKDVQSQSILNLLKNHPAGIAISPLDTVYQSTVLAQVAGATTLVTFDSDSPVSRRLCFVGTDNYAAGRMCGEAVKRAVPDGGEVVICMGVPNKDNTQRRRQALIDELLDRPVDPLRAFEPTTQPIRGEKYTVIATIFDNSDRTKAVELAASALKEHPNVKCFVGFTSYSAPSVVQALKDANKLGGAVKVVGFDIDERTLAGIESGDIFATVMQDQYGLGYHAVRIMAAEAYGNRGELPAFQMHVLPCTVVTKENVASVRKGATPAPSSGATVAASSAAPKPS